MFKKINSFFALSGRDKILFLETLILLTFSKLVILFIPLRKVAPYLGKLHGNRRLELTELEKNNAERIKNQVLGCSNNVPWKSVCLDQAMATTILLNRRKIPNSLYLGVKKDETQSKIEAHAWVECGNEILIGGQRSRKFTVVAFFTNSLNEKEVLQHGQQ